MVIRQTQLLFICICLTGQSSCVGPVVWGIAAGLGAVGTGLYGVWDKAKCPFQECCSTPWLKHNVTQLEHELDAHVFGQHLVRSIVSRALRSHLKKESPKKALVLSFHGWTGSGKNFVAKFIAEALFKEGLASEYVHVFPATLYFYDDQEVTRYKANLHQWIQGNVSACAQSLFVFDEMDKMPLGVIDAIKPFIDHHEHIDGVDHRRAVYVLLSNTGGAQITNELLKFWADGRPREDISYSDLEHLIEMGAFNENGGLQGSNVIERSLIDHYVPFLPLERDHLKKCIEAELRERQRHLSEAHVDSILKNLNYWPKDRRIYSTTGCKRISQAVDMLLEEQDEQQHGGSRSDL